MKKIVFGWMCICGLLALTGCEQQSYSTKRKQENKLIQNYLNRMGINVLETMPADDYVWKENDYYRVAGYDDLYFHLVKRGDSIRIGNNGDTIHIDKVSGGETIVIRYKEYELTETSDTTSNWTTNDAPFPVEFKYDGYGDRSTSCVGWQVAVGLMKYPESSCKVIVPSKQGFSAAVQDVKPYGYDLYMRVKP